MLLVNISESIVCVLLINNRQEYTTNVVLCRKVIFDENTNLI